MKKVNLFFLIGMLNAAVLFSQDNNITLKVVVIGPGDELYLWWGHIALIIEDSVTGRNYAYDYGQFSFEQDNFFYNFAFGRLFYNCGVSNADAFLFYNSLENRDIIIYTLDVTPQKANEVMEFANKNVLPENRIYEYHHFDDNCSTRIRDIIDIAVNGQFYKKYANETGRFTLREHIRRHTWFSPPTDWILNFLMGQVIDTPITVWEEMFLPSEVGRIIKDFYYTDENGINRKLVKNIEVYKKAVDRPIVLEKPENKWYNNLLFGIFISLTILVFYILSEKKRIGQILAGVSISILSLIFGIASLILYFMSLFTNHDYTFRNMNMIFSSPILLIAVPFGFLFAFTKKPENKIKHDLKIRLVWSLSVLGIIISSLLHIFPCFFQDNIREKMLMLPISLIIAFHPEGFKQALQRIKKWRLKK